MRKTLALIVFSISVFLHGKAQSLQWVENWGGAANDYANQLEIYNNDLYTGGNFSGNFSIDGTTTVSSTGGEDIFFAKQNQNGQLSWIKTIGSTFNELVDLKIDNQGNIILLGKFSGVMDFDPSSAVFNITSVSNCCPDLFFAKYANNGDFLWAKNLGGLDQFFGNSLALDNAGNIYFAGILNGTIDFDPSPNINNLWANFDGFFTKYSPQGDLIWAHILEGAQNCSSEIYSISVDNNNHIYIAGNFVNSVDFDPSANQNIVTSTVDDYDAFFASYTENGDLLWAKKFGNQGMEYAFQVKSDNNGSLYLSGTAPSNNIDFDPSSNVASLSNSGFFLAKYTTSGDFNWVTNASGVKFDLSTEGIITGCEVVISHLNVAYGSSNFSRISNSGNIIWEKSAAYATRDLKDLGSKIFLTGSINGSQDVDPGEGTLTISTNGQPDVCLTHYFDCNTEAPVNSSILSISNVHCFGDSSGSATIQGLGGVPPYSYIWSNGQTGPNSSSLNSGFYIGIVYDSNLCEDTSVVFIQQPDFTPASICLVTVDSLSQNNIIVWDKSVFLNQPIDSFIVHREVQTDVYMPLGSISINDLSQFIDTFRTLYFSSPYWSLGDPNAGTYRYKLQWKDTCGNLSPLSNYHNTIFISNNNGTFTWPQLYTIENGIDQPINPVSQYLLLRDNFNDGNWQVVNSVSGTQQSITDPAYSVWSSTANYKVTTQWNYSCTATQISGNNDNQLKSTIYNSSQSNTFRPVLGFQDNYINKFISIFPNPTSNNVTINISEDLIKGKFTIQDNTGRMVNNGVFTTTQEQIELSNLSNGVYVLSIEGYPIQKLFIKQ